MNKADFESLLQGIREVGQIRRGEIPPARLHVFVKGERVKGTDARTIRENLKLSQSEFAKMLNISVATLQNWEQGRRAPDGPAKTLLRVAATHPEAVLHAANLGSKPRLPRRKSKAKTR